MKRIRKENDKQISPETKKKGGCRRTVECVELSTTYQYRRAFSELQLLDAMPKLKLNHTYNFITAGDVDALSFLKIILREQNIKYMLLSTWCMAAEDILQIEKWIIDDKIKKIDWYLGEIFPNSYKIEFKMINNIIEKYQNGRVVVFRNHSKIFAGYGDKFHFGIQSSANINTNPRTENASITINENIFNFYKDYFDKIKSFV